MWQKINSRLSSLQRSPALLRASLLAAICAWFCLSPQALSSPDVLDQTLDAVDSKSFIDGLLGPASGISGVQLQAEKSAQVQFLLNNATEAIPRMTRRLVDRNAIHYRLTPIVYFIVFKKSKDAQVMPALAAYLDSLSDNDRTWASVYFEENPFAYAIEAIATFIPLSSEASNEPFSHRHEIANQLRSEFKRLSLTDK